VVPDTLKPDQFYDQFIQGMVLQAVCQVDVMGKPHCGGAMHLSSRDLWRRSRDMLLSSSLIVRVT